VKRVRGEKRGREGESTTTALTKVMERIMAK
jgi:hypothetical protein